MLQRAGSAHLCGPQQKLPKLAGSTMGHLSPAKMSKCTIATLGDILLCFPVHPSTTDVQLCPEHPVVHPDMLPILVITVLKRVLTA